MKLNHVDGTSKGKVVVYALSTCIWCRKTKNLLNDLGIAYDFVDVDLESAEERKTIEKEILKWKARAAYPLIVIDDARSITSFDEDEIKKEFQ
jgi:glutaredoxin-like protein NrdH